MCSLVTHDKKQPVYEDEEIIIWDRLISKNEKAEALEVLVATISSIEVWLKQFEENYEVICGMYKKYMKYTFKQIPTSMIKALIPKQKVQKLMTEIGGGWYKGKIAKGLPPLRISKLSKNNNIRRME